LLPLSPIQLEYDKYKHKRNLNLEYDKWLSLGTGNWESRRLTSPATSEATYLF